jgi:transcriptional regulator with XRE-family HTH domain
MDMNRIKFLRDENELTQTEISNILGCSRSAYSLWEINKNVIPLYYLNKISNFFNVNIDYLTGLSENKFIEFRKNEINKKELGKKIKLARKEKHLSQETLAKKLNTTHSVISAYELGKTTVPTLFLIEISKITNKSLNWFLDKNKKIS